MNLFKCASIIGKAMITLTVFLSILRITEVIHCSWIWVLTPIWLPIVLLCCLGVAVQSRNID